MQPCEERTITRLVKEVVQVEVEYQLPLDLYLILDGSGSMASDEFGRTDPSVWNDSKAAAVEMINTFDKDRDKLQIAALQFSSQNAQHVISPLTTDFEGLKRQIWEEELQYGQTYLAPAINVARNE